MHGLQGAEGGPSTIKYVLYTSISIKVVRGNNQMYNMSAKTMMRIIIFVNDSNTIFITHAILYLYSQEVTDVSHHSFSAHIVHSIIAADNLN